jgi:hypothetical protein
MVRVELAEELTKGIDIGNGDNSPRNKGIGLFSIFF